MPLTSISSSSIIFCEWLSSSESPEECISSGSSNIDRGSSFVFPAKRKFESNNFNEGSTIAIIADTEKMIFEGKVDEAEVGKLREGMDLVLKIGALEKIELRAKLDYIAPKGVEEEGAITFIIKASINHDGSNVLRVGYSANADIILSRKDSVLVVEEQHLIFENDSTFVEVEIEDQKFKKQPIITGLSDGIHIEVLEGLTLEHKIKKL